MSDHNTTIKLPQQEIQDFIELLRFIEGHKEDIIALADDEATLQSYEAIMDNTLPRFLETLYDFAIPELAQDIEQLIGSRFASYPERTVKRALAHLAEKPHFKSTPVK